MKKLITLLLLALVMPAWADTKVPVNPEYVMPPGKIYINRASLPNPRFGYKVPRFHQEPCVGTLTACDNGTAAPHPSADSGAFRIDCRFSHASFDDPIVWPGRPGKTHLHQFFGNQSTSAASDLLNMPVSGNSSCQGGTLNRTGYWTPTFVYHCPVGSTDGCTRARDGEVIFAESSNFYYKTAGESAAYLRANYKWFPPGFRMIAGNPNNTVPDGTMGGANPRFVCNNSSGAARPRAGLQTGSGSSITQFHHIPSTDEVADMDQCSEITVLLAFPGCGVAGGDIDSPDHQSHVAYGDFYQGCTDPAYPVQYINGLSFNLHFAVNRNDLSYIRLSSDPPKSSGLPGGVSMHGDWVNGWTSTVYPVAGATKSITDLILDTCLRRPLGANGISNVTADCHNAIIGNADGDPTHWFLLD